jgi:hypothetical protein
VTRSFRFIQQARQRITFLLKVTKALEELSNSLGFAGYGFGVRPVLPKLRLSGLVVEFR